jgi:2-polyprenyl-6-methoxyphenol hydroxylase-like FAD-dependent oxidoreductase
MTPDLGQGGGQAPEDAATLTRLLEGGDVDTALVRYDALRRPRTTRLLHRARRVGAVAQASSPLAAGLRDAVLRLTPGTATATAMRRVQQWSPPEPAAPVTAPDGVPTPRP